MYIDIGSLGLFARYAGANLRTSNTVSKIDDGFVEFVRMERTTYQSPVILKSGLKISRHLSLDFLVSASIAGSSFEGIVMNESDKEYIRRTFADLTGVLEDASAIALKGQSSQLTTETTERIVQSIEKTLAHSGNILNSIKNRMER